MVRPPWASSRSRSNPTRFNPWSAWPATAEVSLAAAAPAGVPLGAAAEAIGAPAPTDCRWIC